MDLAQENINNKNMMNEEKKERKSYILKPS